MVHKALPEAAVKLPTNKRLKQFDKFKKLGIDKYNFDQLGDEDANFLQEHSSHQQGDENLIRCSTCKGYFAKPFFSRHRIFCNTESCPTTGVELSDPRKKKVDDTIIPDDFRSNIFNKIRDDKVGEICRNDKPLIEFGILQYDKLKGRMDKDVEVKKSVRAALKTLGTLYNLFMDEDHERFYQFSCDMLRRENFPALRKAIDVYTTKEDLTIKAGLYTTTLQISLYQLKVLF